MRRNRAIALTLLAATGLHAQELATVVAKPVSRMIELPGEVLPYLIVGVRAKVPGYVEKVTVDRGSTVKEGEVLVELSAPEMMAQIVEAESKVQAVEAERAQAEVQVSAAQATYDRMKRASETPGAIAGNELIQAEKQVEAAKAMVEAKAKSASAAQAAIRPLRDLSAYLKITAPFEGVVTERMVHPGALVGRGGDAPLLTIEQLSRLRLVVPVPEEDVSGIVNGATVIFTVPAWPEREFSGKVARVAHSMDQKTRTMAVELEVTNRDGELAPGMFPTVRWPVRRAKASLWVPKSAVVTTTERTFVVRDRDGKAEWVNVKKGVSEGDLMEVRGELRPGDRVAKRATDEIQEGSALRGAKQATK